MEMEYVPTRRRGRAIVLLGVILAASAGAGAFVVVNNAQQTAEQASTPRISVLVAARPIPARKTIDAGDITVRQVPVDGIAAGTAIEDPALVVGRVAAVSIPPGQPLTANLFATSLGNGGVAVLTPDETVAPDSPAWRAVAINVPDDRALGGLLEVGQTVDVFVTVAVSVSPELPASSKYYTDRSTKIAYQGVPIIAKKASYYVVRVTQQVAEEISHLQASGSASFSFALRPDIDTRITSTAGLGETTNLLIQRYGIPVPEQYPDKTSKINNPAPGSPPPLPYLAIGSPAPSPAP